ncbi:MAG: hypothetical protein M1826_002422 [Phylliscum demangeonii]|nr:MAG: hypothetical protein M1826_002422 [Phylliscum demangeonii]
MNRYILNFQNSGVSAVDDLSNMLLLRSDIHSSFDKRRLVFVPKASCFVAHVLVPAPELIRLYQNAKMQPLHGVSIEFLLARLAWAIFPFVEGFLDGRVPRCILVNMSGRSEEVELSAQECQELVRGKQSHQRTPSPKKRDRNDPNPERRDQDEPGSEPKDVTPPASGKRRSCAGVSLVASVAPAYPQRVSDKMQRKGYTEDSEILKKIRLHLQKERVRSDPDSSWVEELHWTSQALDSVLTAKDARHLLRNLGAGVIVENSDGEPFTENDTQDTRDASTTLQTEKTLSDDGLIDVCQ